MPEIQFTSKLRRDFKRMKNRGKNMSKLDAVLRLLATRQPMAPKYRDHQLKGKMKEFRECHIESDWLLIYQIFEDKLILSASGTGTHSDLFNG